MDSPVLVVGGGPVGLATALELAHHGIASTVIEPRQTVSWLRPRAKTVSARTMELFRRWGLAGSLRERAALPVAWSQEAVFATALLGREVTRIDRCFGLELTGDERVAESGQQAPQPLVEQLLREAAADTTLVTLRTGVRVTAVRQTAEAVTAQLSDGRTVRAAYAVGADGSRSVTRTAIGARYEGEADARPNVNIVFRAPGLAGRVPHGPAVHYWILNPDQAGLIGRLDLADTWWCIAQGVAEADADPPRILRTLLGADHEMEILATDPWRARMLLVDRYAAGRIFLAGDSAHQNPPWGGHGFNTGVGDAVNLGWKLAAVLDGWAPAALLDSYEAERRPIAAQTIAAAARNMSTLAPELADPRLTGTDAEFARARPAVAEAVHRTKDGEFHSLDLVLGYSYRGSPVIARDAGERLPHRWLAPGDSLYDHLGRELTLLGRSPEFADAARRAGIPLHLYDDGRPDLVLVRPDQHVAWHGAAADDALAILRQTVGHPTGYPKGQTL